MSRLTVVAYHYVRPIKKSRYPGIKGCEFDKFKRQIAYLKANYSLITMEQLMEAVSGGKSLPDNACLLTFDDGYSDHYDYVFPVLMNEGIQGSFYIPGKLIEEECLLDVNKIHYVLAAAPNIMTIVSDVKELMDKYRGAEFDYPGTDELFEEYAKPGTYDPGEVIFVKRMLQTVLPEQVRHRMADELFERYLNISMEVLAGELYMNKEQIACMKNSGMHIGIHGYEHCWLGRIPTDEMERDITKALDALSPFIDRGAWSMNYPYGLPGAYNDEVISFIEKKGCALGFTMLPEIADLKVNDRFLIPRIDTNEVKELQS